MGSSRLQTSAINATSEKEYEFLGGWIGKACVAYFLNYTKLAILARKTYTWDSKNLSAKKLLSVGIEPGTSCVLL